MSTSGLSPTQIEIRESIQKICKQFPDEYWAEKDSKSEYAGDLHRELAKAGYLGICMPTEHGGTELGISEATIMMETISESGAGVAGCQTIHANVYATVPILRFASTEQKGRYLPKIINGSQRTCFGVTEPNTGLDTLKLQTRAEKFNNSNATKRRYLVSGQKIWITNAQAAERMVLLARTTPLEQLDTSHLNRGLSVFYCDFARGKREGSILVQPIQKMGGRAVDANQVYFDNFEIDENDLIGSEGEGFKIILHGMKYVYLIFISSFHISLPPYFSLGLGYAALRRATEYARVRRVFNRTIGQNQAIQHPLAQSWCALEAAKMLTLHAARRFDEVIGISNYNQSKDNTSHAEVGALCNAAKYIAAEAAFEACERAVMTHGGMGYAADFHVERYLRESFVPRLAPVSREMILNFIGQKVLGLPKSY
ncbi:acyl-CoA dehydrogenase NM domain-like protein [Fomitiporia mediterranea MF3/22]|uniref:acyl-CoA dehydrogenase NM domain-like protein n=1 Tax=Fomitiporia mediterranea (strain MF3/22) TaxID=694068 RepID=UPI0004408783|nr:acyl-CoA dehydrogenase NM domain-like protein [Fomitiporia mediterranea MF3/22]EJD08374.1 acyl-CoA dehydrogenase NM domain-like protein [Fomitiporia mediterranea MF3/22]